MITKRTKFKKGDKVRLTMFGQRISGYPRRHPRMRAGDVVRIVDMEFAQKRSRLIGVRFPNLRKTDWFDESLLEAA